jgi:hypothetical protein
MAEKEALANIRYLHGSYNILMMLLFFYQGRLGLTIRKARISGSPPPLASKRKHRRNGPILALFAILGFFGGLALVYFDHHNFFEYPIHLFTGFLLSSLILISFALSRNIREEPSPWRRPHFLIGIAVLSLYILQVLIGMGILL